MTLRVIIHRGGKETPYYGTLRAWVIQGGKHGEDLLRGHRYSSVETAKTEILRRLAGHEVEFEVKE